MRRCASRLGSSTCAPAPSGAHQASTCRKVREIFPRCGAKLAGEARRSRAQIEWDARAERGSSLTTVSVRTHVPPVPRPLAFEVDDRVTLERIRLDLGRRLDPAGGLAGDPHRGALS